MFAQALYRGNGANVARLVPEIGFKYALHEQLQVMFAPSDGTLPGVTHKLVTSSATGTEPPTNILFATMCMMYFEDWS